MSEQKDKGILDRCKIEVVEGPDGVPHFEVMCETEADRAEMAQVYNEEAVLRVKPKAKLADE